VWPWQYACGPKIAVAVDIAAAPPTSALEADAASDNYETRNPSRRLPSCVACRRRPSAYLKSRGTNSGKFEMLTQTKIALAAALFLGTASAALAKKIPSPGGSVRPCSQAQPESQHEDFAACHVAHIDPPVLLYSAAPHTVIRLARTGHGIGIVPSQMMTIPREGIRTVPLIHRRASIGRWAMIAWHAQRFLAPYAVHFVNELVASVRRDFPGCDLVRRAPALPQPKVPVN
jgi:DNA-binding transcriptional LysR family regulator